MRIDLRRFFESDDLRHDFEYDFSSGDELIPAPVHVKGYVKVSSGVVSLTAVAVFTVETQCAKCTEDISRSFSIPVEHFLVERLNDESNDEYIPVENLDLNLDELVLEDIFLFLPSRFLCKDECRGLCPMCGKNLNDGDCSCKKPVDPRFAALQQLLADDDN